MLATLLAATVFLGLAITAGAQGLLVSEIKVEGAGYVSASVIENGRVDPGEDHRGARGHRAPRVL